MAQQQFSNGESNLSVRNKLNGNATDAENRVAILEAFKAAATAAGLALLNAASATAQRTALGLGSAALTDAGDYDAAGAAATAQAAAEAYADGLVAALDAVVVKLTGAQAIAGSKTFAGPTVMGTETDNTTVSADGHLSFAGAAIVYDDFMAPLQVGKSGNSNIPTWATFKNNLNAQMFAVGDWLEMNIELLHRYKEGTDVEIHLHWATNGTDADDRYVKWEVEYTIANVHASFPTTTVASVQTTITAGTSDRYNQITDIATIPGTGLKIGAQLKCRIRRIAAVGNAPSANPFGLALGCHVQIDTVGSSQPYIK